MSDIRFKDSIFNEEYTLLAWLSAASAKYLHLGLTTEQLACLYRECLEVAIFNNDLMLNIYCTIDSLPFRYQLSTRPGNTLEYYREMMKQGQVHGDFNLEMIALLTLASEFMTLNDYQHAILYGEKCVIIAKKIGDRNAESKAYLILLKMHFALQQHKEVIVYGKLCINLANKKVDKITAFYYLGKTHHSLNEYDDAIFYTEKCVQLAEEIDDGELKINAYLELANIYKSLRRHEDAILFCKKCIDIAKESNNEDVDVKAHLLLCIVYFESKRHNDFLLCTQKVIDAGKVTGDKKGEMTAYMLRAQTYNSLEEYDNAIINGKKSIGMARNLLCDYRLKSTTAFNGIEAEIKAVTLRGYLAMAEAYLNLHEYDNVIIYGKKSIDMAINLLCDARLDGKTALRGKEPDIKADALCGYLVMAEAHLNLHEHDDSILCSKKSLIIAKKLKNKKFEMKGYLFLGKAYQSLNQYNNSILYWKKCIDIAEETGLKRDVWSLYLKLGQMYHLLKEYDGAILFCKKCINDDQETRDLHVEMMAYIELANIYYWLEESHNAILHGKRCVDIAIKTDNKEVEMNAYLLLGKAYVFTNQCVDAICFSNKCIEIAKQIDENIVEANAYIVKGRIYHKLGKCDDAILCYKNSIDIAKRPGEQSSQMIATCNNADLQLGEIYYDTNRYDEMISHSNKCIDIAKTSGDKYTEIKAYILLGKMCNKLHQYNKVILYCEIAIAIAIEVQEKVYEMDAYLLLGSAYFSLNQYDNAILNDNKWLGIAKDIGNTLAEMQACLSLGRGYHNYGKDDDAVRYTKEGLNIALETGDKEHEMNAYSILGDAFLCLENYDDAILYSEKYLGIAQQTGDKEHEMNAYIILGDAFLCLEKYDVAISYLEKYLGIAQETGNQLAEMDAVITLGRIYLNKKEYEEAIFYSKKCLAQETDELTSETNTCTTQANVCSDFESCDNVIHDSAKDIDIAKKRIIGHMAAYEVLVESYYFLNNIDDAHLYRNKCIEITNQINDDHDKIRAFLCLCKINNLLKQYEDAIGYGEQCAELAKEIGNKRFERDSLIMLRNIYRDSRQFKDYLMYSRKCVQAAKEVGGTKKEMQALFSLGDALFSCDKYEDAIIEFNECIEIAVAFGEKAVMMRACRILANIYNNLAKYKDSLYNYKLCKATAKETSNFSMEMDSLLCLGSTSISLNQYYDALSYLTEGLKLAEDLKDNVKIKRFKTSIRVLRTDIGMREDILRTDKDHSHFWEIYDTSNDNDQEHDTRRNMKKFWIFYNRYVDHKLREEYEKAIACLEEAMVPVVPDEINNLNFISNTLTFKKEIAEMYVLQGQYDKGIQCYKEALALAIEFDSKQNQAFFYFGLGTAYYQLKRTEEAKASFKESIKCFEAMFDDLGDHDQFKISMVDKYCDVYKMLLKLLIKTKQKKEALLLSDRFRARALNDLLVTNFGMKKEVIAEQSLNYTDVQALVSSHNYTILSYSTGVGELYAFVVNERDEPEFSDKLCVYCEICFDKDIENKFNEMKLRQILECEDRSLDAILNLEVNQNRKSVQKDLEFTQFWGHLKEKIEVENGLEFTCQAFEDCEVIDKTFKEKNVRQPMECENGSLDATEDINEDNNNQNFEEDGYKPQNRNVYEEPWREDDENSNALRQLHKKFLEKIIGYIKQDEVVIITDGLLSKVPFAALLDPKTGRYLSETKRIRFAPSITTLKFLQECPADFYYKTGALIIGDPLVGRVMLNDIEQFIGSLKNARKEAEELAKIFRVKPLVGEEATKPVVMEKLKQGASIVHIAAHGILEQSAVLLSPSPETRAIKVLPDEEDYLLTMADVQKAQVRAQLVVLSCCHSGRGEIRAEGVVGMCRAFLASGARAVVASLWAIEDSASLAFMRSFYRHLKEGKSASESLQMTMNDMRNSEDYKEPMYWAPFFLMGDDVTIDITSQG